MASPYPAAKYIISKRLDPLFAIIIGLSAAIVRIRNEEILKRSGLPSSSMVISPRQKQRIDERRARMQSRPRATTFADFERGLGSIDGDDYSEMGLFRGFRGGAGEVEEVEKVDVGYAEVLRLGWERAKWRMDYWWNDRGKDRVRKDGRMV